MTWQERAAIRDQARDIVRRGLADELVWLGEITPDERAALTYQPKHAKEPR